VRGEPETTKIEPDSFVLDSYGPINPTGGALPLLGVGSGFARNCYHRTPNVRSGVLPR